MMCIDDYGILDTQFLVHAVPINPCPDHPEEAGFLIGALLSVGDHLERCSLLYPTRLLRDAALEKLYALVRADEAGSPAPETRS